MKLNTLFAKTTIITLSLAGFAAVGCVKKDEAQKSAEAQAESVRESAEKQADSAEKAGDVKADAINNQANTAADATRDAASNANVEKAADKIENTAEAQADAAKREADMKAEVIRKDAETTADAIEKCPVVGLKNSKEYYAATAGTTDMNTLKTGEFSCFKSEEEAKTAGYLARGATGTRAQ